MISISRVEAWVLQKYTDELLTSLRQKVIMRYFNGDVPGKSYQGSVKETTQTGSIKREGK